MNLLQLSHLFSFLSSLSHRSRVLVLDFQYHNGNVYNRKVGSYSLVSVRASSFRPLMYRIYQ